MHISYAYPPIYRQTSEISGSVPGHHNKLNIAITRVIHFFFCFLSVYRSYVGKSVTVQWLGLHTVTAEGLGSILNPTSCAARLQKEISYVYTVL